MDRIRILGGNSLKGECKIAGAKNACLKLQAASLLTEEPVTLLNAPRLSDIRTMNELLASLGSEIALLSDGQVIVMNAKDIKSTRAEYDIVRKMRASSLVLGPLLARFGDAEVSLPGGCAIGARPIDQHLNVIEALGAKYELVDGYVHASAPKGGLKGGEYEFPFVTVGGTETALLTAVLANGTSVFKNVAREPEIIDLANLLNKMGAKIEGAGTSTIIIEGVKSLGGTTHEVVMDRIELGSYMIAPAMTGGDVFFPGAKIDLLAEFADKLRETGVEILEENGGLRVKHNGERIKPVNIVTAPFPGFATDLQAQLMALLCLADGSSICEETIFENRFMHAPELVRMGADIQVDGNHATIHGVQGLKGAPVMATDLRASFSLILAALAAEGETIIRRVYHLDRGYEQVVRKFRSIGAELVREADE